MEKNLFDDHKVDKMQEKTIRYNTQSISNLIYQQFNYYCTNCIILNNVYMIRQ